MKSLNFPLYKTQLCTKWVKVYQGEIKENFAKVFRIYFLNKKKIN